MDAAAMMAQAEEAVREVERERIRQALLESGGNQRRAAEILGLSRRTLVNRLNEFNLPRPRKGRS